MSTTQTAVPAQSTVTSRLDIVVSDTTVTEMNQTLSENNADIKKGETNIDAVELAFVVLTDAGYTRAASKRFLTLEREIACSIVVEL